MSLKSQILLSGKIDNTSLINFPTYLKVDADKKYKLSVREDYIPLRLKFSFKVDGYELDLPFFEKER